MGDKDVKRRGFDGASRAPGPFGSGANHQQSAGEGRDAGPMSIASMISVPLFVLMNLWVAWRVWF